MLCPLRRSCFQTALERIHEIDYFRLFVFQLMDLPRTCALRQWA